MTLYKSHYLALLKPDPRLARVMSWKFRAIVADLICLYMPTIAAVTGHASTASFILAMSHNYTLMHCDRGFLYVSELDIRPLIPAWFTTLIRLKMDSPATRPDVVLTAAKLTTAEVGRGKGIVDSVHGSAVETVEAAVRLGQELVREGGMTRVRSDQRDVLDVIGFDETRRMGCAPLDPHRSRRLYFQY